jgi:hypothetical protein
MTKILAFPQPVQPVGFGPCKDQNPQAEARATKSRRHNSSATSPKYLFKWELVAITVTVHIVAGSRLGINRLGLLCRLADRDCVLRDRGGRCGLLTLGWLSRLLSLGLRLHWLNRLDRMAHAIMTSVMKIGK